MHKIKISTGRPFTAEEIWNKLESLYQLDMLDETEILNFQLCEKTHFRNLSKISSKNGRSIIPRWSKMVQIYQDG